MSSVAAGRGEADARLVGGAAYFRKGQFDRALIEFKVARELGARGEVAWYIGAALTKLQRPDDALEAFAAAESEASQARDALLVYYQAMACYDAHLLACADRLLGQVSSEAGPRIRAQAEQVRAQIALVLSAEIPRDAIDALLVRGEEALKKQRAALAEICFREAAELATRRADRYQAQHARTRRNAAAQVRGSP